VFEKSKFPSKVMQERRILQTPVFALALAYLLLLEEKEGYSYLIAKRTGCHAGTLAKRFSALRQEGFLSLRFDPNREGRGRKVYSVTDKGKRKLGESLEKAIISDTFADRPEFDLQISRLRERVAKVAYEAQYED